MDLIPEQELQLQAVTSDPIGEIIRASTVMRDMNLQVRTRLIAELITKIEELDTQGENTFSRNMMLGIGSSFSMAAAIASSSAFPPLAGICLSIGALTSWGACMYEVFNENTKIEPIRDVLKRLLLALKSAPTDKWAAIWSVCGNDIFIYALKEASKGHIVRDKLVQVGQDRPIDRAIDTIAAFSGQTYEDVTAAARAVLAGKSAPTQPKITQPQRESFGAIEAEVAPFGRRVNPAPVQPVRQELPVTKIQEPVVPVMPQPATPKADRIHQEIVDLILEATSSLVFIGGQRCGKSWLMAISSLIGVQRGRYTKVSVISSLTRPNEDPHYWRHCQTQAFYDLKAVVNKTPYYEEFTEVIRTFKRTATAEDPQLLIIDEFAFLAQSASYDASAKGGNNASAQVLIRELVELGSVISSATEKNGWYVWFGSPKGNVGDFAEELRPVIKGVSLCYCAIAPGGSVRTSTGGAISWDVALFDATQRNWSVLKGNEPPRGALQDLGERIVQFNGKWHKATQYTLDSYVPPVDQTAFKQEIAKRDALTPQDRESLKTAVAVNNRSQADILIELLERSQASSLEDFIRNELRETQRVNEVKTGIIAALTRYGRNDLLQRFAAN